MKQMLLALWCSLLTAGACTAADWQWSVPVPAGMARPNETPRAYLWIPPDCHRVRAVVVGVHNMEEEAVFEHPSFRRALQDLGLAALWVTPAFDMNFRFDQGAGEQLQTLLSTLAEHSGYAEMATAPLVPIGHSAAASLPWYMAAWQPERIVAGLSFSGQWPYLPDPRNAPHVAGRNIDSVPGLVTLGEYEWADERLADGLATRAAHPEMPLSALGIPADGHFLATDEKIAFLALYLRKAVAARLPPMPADAAADAPVTLRAIDVRRSGWLAERYRKDGRPSAAAAPVDSFKGDRSQAFWWFDGELAQAAEALQARHRGLPALLGYVQDGAVLPQKNGTHQQVSIPFRPAADGISFKLSATFLDHVPEGRPERWVGKRAGSSLVPPAGGGADIRVERISGPVRQVAQDTWELAFTRASFLSTQRNHEAWLAAVWPGDEQHKRAMQQARLNLPLRNHEGAAQTISFELPPRWPADAQTLRLSAQADSGLPVRFFVREGPAELKGDMLHLRDVPPRARYPMAITVVAWQFGRASDPKVQSATPVERTVWLHR